MTELTLSDFTATKTRASKYLGAEQRLRDMVGFDKVAAYVEETKALVAMRDDGANPQVLANNLKVVVTGNSGTGKTTLARLLHKVFYSCGIVQTDRFEELSAVRLQAAGHKLKTFFSDARGGTIFLDEAYALRSNVVTAQLLTELESVDNRDTLVVLAGYEKEMQAFFDTNQVARDRYVC